MKKSAKTALSATLLVSVLAAAAVPAFAQPGGHGERGQGPRIPIVFSELDANGDGVITQEEMDARKAAKFAEIDTDGDGQLSADELMAQQAKQEENRRMKRAERMIERLDANDDGLVSAEEMASHEGERGKRGSLFERADLDDDGKVTEEEFKTAMAKAKKFREGGRFGKKNH